jgi:hypothetical protein
MPRTQSTNKNERWLATLSVLLLAACGGGAGGRLADGGKPAPVVEKADGGGDPDDVEPADAANMGTSDSGTSSRDAGNASGGGARDAGGDTGSAGPAASCMAASLLNALKLDHMLIGASMNDESAKAAPFDARYLYLAGGLFDGDRACASCASSCIAGGKSCANNAGGCIWWGCWQYDQDPPGAYVRGFVERATADHQVPMISYYEILQASGAGEGAAEVGAANDAGLMRRYLADFAFVLDQIGGARALVHIEPDFWAYAQQVNQNPAAIPAKVASANDECKSFENNLGGLGRCMIHLVRIHAPNARVGLHGSSWATKVDVLSSGDANLDVAGEAQKLGQFLLAAGAADSDFVVIDASDRDAAWYKTQGRDTWWDNTNKTLPNFKRAFAWAKSLAETVKKPVVWWQVPVGNMQLPDQQQRWKDNRLDYFFDHPEEIAASHGAGVLFGAGDGNQTNPETDDGHLIARMKAHGGMRQPACP